jgi:hypothetical protein
MARQIEPRFSEPVLEAELMKDPIIDDFIIAMRDRKAFIKKDVKSRSVRFFWGDDDEDWFYQTGIGPLKKPIELGGLWIRKDMKQFLESRKEEGWLFYLEKK